MNERPDSLMRYCTDRTTIVKGIVEKGQFGYTVVEVGRWRCDLDLKKRTTGSISHYEVSLQTHSKHFRYVILTANAFYDFSEELKKI